jgi:hypothetical protein
LSAKDDLGGSGIASFDLFVSTNGGPFGYWLKDTISTASVFIGDLGNSYQFYSIARDLVGNAEAAPVKHDAQTMVITNAPLLAFVTDQVAAVEAELVVSNRVTSASSESFLWSLGPRAPYGAAINRTNGVLRWKPGCFQGSTTNQIIVWATDRMRTNISDAITITVAVRECVSPQLGRLVLGTGDTGRLPIDLISSVPLTNLSTFVSAPSGRVIPVSVEPVAPEICMSSIENVADSLYLITLTTCSNQFLVGTQQIAWLVVRAPTNQQSAFVPVVIGPSVGTQPDGTFVTNYVTQAGRVVIVDEEPLLEAFHSTNGFVQALLYAPVGSTNILQINRELRPQSAWMPAQQVEMTNLLRTLPPFPATNQTLFFRAVRQ